MVKFDCLNKGCSRVFYLIVMIIVFGSVTKVSANWIYKYEGSSKIQGSKYAIPNIGEPTRLDLVAQYLPENPIIFEAGAHYGEHTAILANRWPKGSVIAFEANPPAYIKAVERTKDLPNAYPYHLAVNSYNGEALLHVCYGTHGNNPAFEGASSLLEASKGMKQHYQGPKVYVPCVVLDDWCKENDVDHFDFMWLDLEGLELQILKSSPEILSKLKVIYTETNFREFRKGMTQYKTLKSFLEASGFTLLAHWYAEDGAGPFQGDAVFIRKSLLK